MNFQFDQIAIYKAAEERIRCDRYSNQYYNRDNQFSRDGDVLIKFTVEKYAIEQATNNHELLLSQAREVGAKILIQGLRGPQIIVPGDEQNSQRIFKGYRTAFEAGFENQNTYSYINYVGEPSSFASSRAVAVSCRGYKINNGHTLSKFKGVFDVVTGKKITGRSNILDLLWQQGFLAERGQVLYAASPSFGTPSDIETYNDIRNRLQLLSPHSPLRAACYNARRKISRNCDWPQQYN